MGGVTAIIAVIALFAALGALWMVTEAVKKIDLRTRRVVEAQTKGLKSSFSELAHLFQKNNKTHGYLMNMNAPNSLMLPVPNETGKAGVSMAPPEEATISHQTVLYCHLLLTS